MRPLRATASLPSRSAALVAALGTVLVGCGDVTFSTGEYGHVVYSVYTDYGMGGAALTDVGIITRYPQRFSTYLTDSGMREADDPTEVTHTVSPAGATLVQDPPYEYDEDRDPEAWEVPDFAITATDPGVYTITSSLDGEVLDLIDLSFEVPAALDLVLWKREPYEESFVKIQPSNRPIPVPEGTEVAFLVVPLGETSERLVGQMPSDWTADPERAVVPGGTVLGIYEDAILGSMDARTFFFIEPGDVTLFISDLEQQVTATQGFAVSAWADQVTP